MDTRKLKNNITSVGRDIMFALIIVAIIMLGLFAYSGIWPPMVVIESGSMEHPPVEGVHKSYLGVIDTGDMVFVKKVSQRDDLVTYVGGQETDYSKYGTFGDVVVYRPNGLCERADGTPVVPIIHRLVIWLEVNDTAVDPGFQGIDYANYSFDVPGLNIYGTTDPIVLRDYGYQSDTITIELGLEDNYGLLRYYRSRDQLPHGGFITMGDNNAPTADQPNYEPVQIDWIIGKAWGELPWFGLIKLWFTGSNLSIVASNSWTGLFATLLILILAPMVADYVIPKVKKLRQKEEEPLEEDALEAENEEQINEGENGPPPDEDKFDSEESGLEPN